MSAVESTAEFVGEVAEEVGDQAYSVADASRNLAGRSFGLAFGGLVIGGAIGGGLGFYFTRRLLETKYKQIAEEEIDEMREHYRAKTTALENTKDKGDLETLVREKGYSMDAEPPMAVTPPASVVEAAEEPDVEPKVDNIFERQPPSAEELGTPLSHGDDWDYEKEKRNRSPVKPYVIHVDERHDFPDYDEVTFTYYDDDDVLCNERDEVLDRSERDTLIGEPNLNKFGHGSGDPSIVYIRNDKLELQVEVVLSPNAYAHEVHGLQHSESLSQQRRRPRRYDD